MKSGETLVGKLGVGSIPVELTPPEACGSGDDLCWAFGSLASIQLTPSPVDERCYSVLWNTSFLHSVKVINANPICDLFSFLFSLSFFE